MSLGVVKREGSVGQGNPINIKTLILDNLAKKVGLAKVRLAKLGFGQTWPKLVRPNLVSLATPQFVCGGG